MLRKMIFGLIAIIMATMFATISEAATLQKSLPAEEQAQEIIPPVKTVYTVNRRGAELKQHECTYKNDYLGVLCGLQNGQMVLVNDDESLFELTAQVDELNRLSPNRKMALQAKDFSAFTESEKQRYEELSKWVVFEVVVSESETPKTEKVRPDTLSDMYNVSNVLSQIKMITQY